MLFERLCATVGAIDSGSNPDYGRQDAFRELPATVAASRRRAGYSPLATYGCPAIQGALVPFLASNGDPRALARIGQDDYLVDPALSGANGLGGHLEFVGRLLAHYDDPAAMATIRRRLKSPGLAGQLPPDALRRFELGLEFGRSEWLHWPEELRPDEDTRLGATLDGVPAEWIEYRAPASPLDSPAPAKTIAKWIFDSSGLRLLGDATGLAARRVPLLPDDGGAGFARLGSVEESELRFQFTSDWSVGRMLIFRIEYQKGRRAWLPYAGEASATLELDGQEYRLPPADLSFFEAEVPMFLRHSNPTHLHTITLRLERTSTTTLRIYHVAILDPRGF